MGEKKARIRAPRVTSRQHCWNRVGGRYAGPRLWALRGNPTVSHARGKSFLASVLGRRDILGSMAGSPLRRQRLKELQCIQPRIPMHQWRAFSDTEKVVAIFGVSLDEVVELMSIPFAGRLSRT